MAGSCPLAKFGSAWSCGTAWLLPRDHQTLPLPNFFPAAKRIAASNIRQRIIDAKGKFQGSPNRNQMYRVDQGQLLQRSGIASIHFAIHQRQCAERKIDFGILLQGALLVR